MSNDTDARISELEEWAEFFRFHPVTHWTGHEVAEFLESHVRVLRTAQR